MITRYQCFARDGLAVFGSNKFIEFIKQARSCWKNKLTSNEIAAWSKALAVAQASKELQTDEAILHALQFIDQQALYGDLDSAQTKYDQLLQLLQSSKVSSSRINALAHQKAGLNEFNLRHDESAVRHLNSAVALFESDAIAEDVAYGEALMVLGKVLTKLKKNEGALEAQKKAFKVYSQLKDDHRLSTLRQDIFVTLGSLKGANREQLREDTHNFLGLRYTPPSPTFTQALKALQKEGYANKISRKMAKQLVPDFSEEDGPVTLLDVLRKYQDTDANNGPGDLLIFAEPSDITELNEAIGQATKHLRLSTLIKATAWNGLLGSPLTVVDGVFAKSCVLNF